MTLEILSQFLDSVLLQILHHAIHGAGLDVIVAVLLTKLQIPFQAEALAFQSRSLIDGQFHNDASFLFRRSGLLFAWYG